MDYLAEALNLLNALDLTGAIQAVVIIIVAGAAINYFFRR